ncbi:MAG: hypothetical protein JWN13_2641 [Betaproteobacteria bacterium]|nr:hypothetical protein [Betaproteobacteria bacterium]
MESYDAARVAFPDHAHYHANTNRVYYIPSETV